MSDQMSNVFLALGYIILKTVRTLLTTPVTLGGLEGRAGGHALPEVEEDPKERLVSKVLR